MSVRALQYCTPKGDDPSTVDIGLVAAAMGGVVWHDRDADGIQDEGEPGVFGVRVELLDDDSGDRSVLAAMTTDSTGRYGFAGIASLTGGSYATGREYTIRVVPPPAHALAPASRGTDERLDSDVDPATGQSDGYRVADGRSVIVDAGLVSELTRAPAPAPPSLQAPARPGG